MARPLRIEFPGAICHVTARGDRREPIFEDDEDRHAFPVVIGQTLNRFDASVLTYCRMDNHYHLVLRTRRGKPLTSIEQYLQHKQGRDHGIHLAVKEGRLPLQPSQGLRGLPCPR